jgi:hypothetical protein
MSGSRGFVASVLASLFVRQGISRPEVATLQNWWCSAQEDQAARELESRLFFDPALVRDVRQAQRSRGWKGAVVAAVIGAAIWVVPVGLVHAEDKTIAGVEEDGGTTDTSMEIAIWEWLLDVVVQTTGGSEDEGSSEDPDR